MRKALLAVLIIIGMVYMACDVISILETGQPLFEWEDAYDFIGTCLSK